MTAPTPRPPLRWLVMATQVPASGSLGGVVRYTTELIAALARRSDVIVSAVTTRAAADTIGALIGDDAQVHTVPGAPVPLLSITERYAPLASLRRGVDVVHGIKHLVPRRTSALRVLTVHDLLLLDRPQDFPLAKRRLLPPFYRASIADADLLVCVSEATRQRLAAQAPGAEGRAAVVHLATSQSLRAADPQPLTALAGRRFVLVVGDSSPRKNLATVMQAWQSARSDLTGTVLAVAGPPSWGQTVLGHLYDELVAAGSVVALGHISDAELRWAYENAALVLCPSLVEGFGLPAAEALGFGAPVIISDDPALVEVCAGREMAIVAPLSVPDWVTAIRHALATDHRTGQQRATEHNRPTEHNTAAGRTWDEVAAETVQAVSRALEQRSIGTAGEVPIGE